LEQYKVLVSMSRKGNCWDNALMESFFGTLKVECVDRQTFETRKDARTIIFEYMEVFYTQEQDTCKNLSQGKELPKPNKLAVWI